MSEPVNILAINGPNLNMLGTREPKIYGAETLADVEAKCRAVCDGENVSLEWMQINSEAEIVTAIQQAIGKAVDRSVLQGWKGAAKGSRRQRMTNLNSQDGLLVNDVLIFKAEPGECYGEKAKYIAFGERPSECVAVQEPAM